MLFVLWIALFLNSILLTKQATQKALTRKHNLILTTPGHRSRKNLLQEATPLNLNLNKTNYDWSLKAQQYFDNPQYEYDNFWWSTIRDHYKFFSSPPQNTRTTKNAEQATESFTQSSTDTNKAVANQGGTESTINPGVNNLDMTQIGKFRPNVANKFIPKSKIGKDFFKRDDPLSYLAGLRARANALKRNKQILRMLDEIAPYDYVKTTTTAKPVSQGPKFDAIAGVFGPNQDFNVTYNKLMENLQSNYGGKQNHDLVQLKGLHHLTEVITEVSIPSGRQDISPQNTPPESTTRGPTAGKPYWWGTTTVHPSKLVEDLKRQLSMFPIGYFSVFVSQCALSMAMKHDNDIRSLALSLEKEYQFLSNQEYFISFGEQFLNALKSFATRLSTFSSDFVKNQAMILHLTMRQRRQQMTAELNEIIDYIDDLFEEDEGLALFKAVELLNNYPNTTENSNDILRAMSDAVFAPYRRLSGSTKTHILIEQINKYLREFDTHLPPHLEEEFTNFNYTKHILRRLNNGTRFAVVSRDNKNKVKVQINVNMRTKKTNNRCGNYFSRSCLDNEKSKFKHTNKITHTSGTKDITYYVSKHYKSIKEVSKKQAVTRFQSATKYPTTRQTEHSKEDLKQKHYKIYNKDIKFKKINKKYYGKYKTFVKTNNHEKISKINVGKVTDSDKHLYNLSETDEVNISDETEYYSDHNTYESTVSAANTISKIELSQEKELICLHKNCSKIANTLKKPITTNVTIRNQVQILNSVDKSDETVEIHLTNVKEPKPVKTVSNIIENKDDLYNEKNKTLPHRKDIFEFTNKPTDRPKNVTVKNKITDQSSYSDEEDILKFQISDAIRHDKEYLNPVRRSYHVENKLRKGIVEFSSYSSEEVILKSNIYKTLGFDNFNTTNKAVQRANSGSDLTVKKIKFQPSKPINEMSSYSDEESILKEKLYMLQSKLQTG